jgi:hypothetical protein
MNIVPQDGLGTTIVGVEGDNFPNEMFSDTSLLHGLTSSDFSVPQEIPGLYYPWIHDLEFPVEG